MRVRVSVRASESKSESESEGMEGKEGGREQEVGERY